jgi:hypothetical protein
MAMLGWSDQEEFVIAGIQTSESVPRAEAIRRMQRRKRSKTFNQPSRTRTCQNPRCTRGDDGRPASLAHLRADAIYCDAACKKAGQRSPNRQKRASNRQCLCGSKGDKNGSLLSPHIAASSGAKNARNREIQESGTVAL